MTHDHKDVVDILLSSGADVGMEDTKGRNTLHRAVASEDSRVLSVLLGKAAEGDVNALNTFGNTPLMETIEKQTWKNAAALLGQETFKFSLKLEEKYSDQRRALGLASCKGEKDVVRLLLQRMASRKATNKYGDTPLHEACLEGHHDVALLLLEPVSIPPVLEYRTEEASVEPKGKDGVPGVESHEKKTSLDHKSEEMAVGPAEETPDINPKNNKGETPLFCAVSKGRNDVVKMLLEKGARPDLSDNSEESLLGCAARSRKEDVFMAVLEATGDINAADKSEQTPLLWLVRHKMEEAAAALLGKGKVDTETHPKYLLEPLHEAIRRCSVHIIGLLLDKTANKLKIDSQGRTALHIAAASGHLEVLKYILESIHKKIPLFDAKFNDKQGRNVLHHAACSGVPEVIKYLLQDHNGESVINNTDNHGWTPLHWAAKSGNEAVFDLLLDHGADPNVIEKLENETVLQLLRRYNYECLARQLPNLAYQRGKSIEEDLDNRRGGTKWRGVSCDGCYCEVSSQHYLLKRSLTLLLLSLFEELVTNVKIVQEIGEGLIFARSA